ncbi:Site-specific recombinase, DNA invertase Pin homologs [Gloeomargarita lithophora Alchichica-D10]|uniref:Site-specific recombinase, DNA invertase Pin homologs n=1 Tax=Gloeomargarita lithophora Alchichica-D10 TaxID=1188229 RepID=A0A1J0AAH7_9CYAN|nr:recombinase family protein [Gloeomargarita lithophora]APB32909.1 Site-specific recombinase, DNA invertase Pin homologs [Gloeomargarita lithophora Alchichica-D10]
MDAPSLRYDYGHPLLDRERLRQMDWESAEPLWLDTTPLRPQLHCLIQQYKNRPGTRVLVPAWDRLGDSLSAIYQSHHALQQAGITLVVAQGNTLDWEQVNHIKKYLQKRYITLGHIIAQGKHRPPPGRVPYGYQWGETGYLPDPKTEPVVRAFFEHFLLYGSVQAAVTLLKENYHKYITPTTGIRWLSAPVYRGHTQTKHQPLQRHTHPALLSPEEAAQIDRIRQRNRKVSRRSASAPHALAGLVRCAQCQQTWRVNSVYLKYKQNTYRYLVPGACPLRPTCAGVPYEPFWLAVLQHLCPQLTQLFEQPLPFGAIKQGLQSQIHQKQQILSQLDELKHQGILDELTTQMRAVTLQTELNQIQNQLAQLPPVNLQEIARTASLPAFWLDLSPVEQRVYLREFLHHIKIQPQGHQYQVCLVFNPPLQQQPKFWFDRKP